MPARDRIEAGFEQVRAERFLRRHRDRAADAAFWRDLNPHLTISDRPFEPAVTPAQVDPAVAARAEAQLLEDGYYLTPPVLAPGAIDALRRGAERVVEAGFPPVFTCVYDEFYRAFAGLDGLFTPLLGAGYLLGLHGLWTFLVPAGDPAYARWTALAPHRDSLGPDPDVLARRLPSIVTAWIPLTDVTPLDSCMYIVPAACDPDYYSEERGVRPERIRLQDVRALPAAAGSVVGWSTHAVHWGSRSSRFAEGPRVAVTAYLQRGDLPPRHPFTVDFEAPLPFGTRLAWIAESLHEPELFGRVAR